MPEAQYLSLILGAGASVPYGLPDGAKIIAELIQGAGYIRGKMRTDEFSGATHYEISPYLNEIFRFLNNNGYPSLTASQLQSTSVSIIEELSLYKPRSIDSYLSNLYGSSSDEKTLLHVDVCKYLIAHAICDHYRLDYEAVGSPNVWMHHLFNAVLYYFHRKNYEVDDLPIKIITFNYDTIIEQHFCKWVAKSKLLTDEKKEKVIRVLCDSITHIYGQVGYIALHKNLSESSGAISSLTDVVPDEILHTVPITDVSHKGRIKRNLALHSIKRLRLIPFNGACDSSDRACSHAITKAKEWLSNSKALIFSGYAFDDDNNKILDLPESIREIPVIYGTLFDSGVSLREKVRGIATKYHVSGRHAARSYFFNGEIVFNGQSEGSGYARFYDSTTEQFFRKEVDLLQLTKDLA